MKLTHPWLAPRIAIPVAACVVLVQLPFIHAAFRGAAPVTAAVPYEDKFDRATLGDAWWSNGGHWRIVNGQVFSPGVGNNPLWLKQTSGGGFVSPREYAGICNAIFTGVHATNYAGEKVACGATGPRGNNQAGSTRPSMSPLAFMRAARRAGMRKMDAYAHHPYYGKPTEAPSFKPSDGTDTS